MKKVETAEEMRNETRSLVRRIRTKIWKNYFDARQNNILTEPEAIIMDDICLKLTTLISLLDSE